MDEQVTVIIRRMNDQTKNVCQCGGLVNGHMINHDRFWINRGGF